MTIRDIQARHGVAKRYLDEQRPEFAVMVIQELYRDVLRAIADSTCLDSPAELAAEALKV